jgi:menaquinone-dependent protoporphyrinogen oxidase
MTRVQVIYASRHGGSEGIAKRIAAVLSAQGADAVANDASTNPDPAGFDAFVVGSGVYLGKWLKEGVTFVEQHRTELAAKPVWLFSSGPVAEVSDDPAVALEAALGPATGPGSGGHKQFDELAAAVHPRDHRVFGGVFDPERPPVTTMERIVRIIPAAKKALPAGDFRDWVRVDAWAGEIARELAPGD